MLTDSPNFSKTENLYVMLNYFLNIKSTLCISLVGSMFKSDSVSVNTTESDIREELSICFPIYLLPFIRLTEISRTVDER